MLRLACARGHMLCRKSLEVSEIKHSNFLKSATRRASQLYPATSQKWDDAMVRAESIVGDSSRFSSLQKWVSGEFNNITKYLERLIGTNHPMLETAKRCTYISEGKMGSAQARGLAVILTSKAVESLAKRSTTDRSQRELIANQISLAEMAEMTYSAYMIHRGVMDLKMHGLEAVDFEQQGLVSSKLEAKHAKGLHYGNKVSVLCGDFLLAYVMRGLGDLFSHKAVDLVASAITEFMEGEFLLIDDWRSNNYLLSNESRDFGRWERRSYSTIGVLQGNTCQAALVLANIDGKLQMHAREFGKNLGMAWQAHTELQPFLCSHYEPIELPEMPPYPAYDLNCLPVLLFMKKSHHENKNFRLMLDYIKGPQIERGSNGAIRDLEINFITQHRHQEPVDYKKLHSLMLDQRYPVEETYKIIRNYSETAMSHLEKFPSGEARDALFNICESLNKK